jgi:hypothetical protein
MVETERPERDLVTRVIDRVDEMLQRVMLLEQAMNTPEMFR